MKSENPPGLVPIYPQYIPVTPQKLKEKLPDQVIEVWNRLLWKFGPHSPIEFKEDYVIDAMKQLLPNKKIEASWLNPTATFEPFGWKVSVTQSGVIFEEVISKE